MKKILTLAVLLAACGGTRGVVPSDEPLARGSAPAVSEPAWMPPLAPDAFDAPAAVSAAEAAKSGDAPTAHVHPGAPSDVPSPEHQHEQTQTGYTCPMHPDVTSAAPGKCPKCGMTLVPRRKP